MKLQTKAVLAALTELASPEKAASSPRFFKARPGEYAEGDRFLGVTVPNQRKVAAQLWKDLEEGALAQLMLHPLHEMRLTGVFILVKKFEKASSESEKKHWVDFYLNHLEGINNWDLVDSSCYQILGRHLYNQSRDLLYFFAQENHLWKNRIAIVSTLYFVKRGDVADTFALAKILMRHPHDLIHKAVGWLLREAGKQDPMQLHEFLDYNATYMPRTMLRYAIEKLDESEQRVWKKRMS